MSEIRVLDKHTAELIAAGEVIECPASVVKELVENSVDAGALHITVEIQSGGIELIRVTDDGKGISFEDTETAFLRHATSKVAEAADLNEITTLGFRGEALASICAVSRVSMLTRRKGTETGCYIEITGGEVVKKEEAGCPVGTTIVVKNLFYNTPARMKFLKKDISEANAVASIVEKIAVSNPEIAFKFIRDGRTDLQTPGDGKLFSAIHAIFGKPFADSLLPVSFEKNGVKIYGYISKPTCSKAKRGMQYFFLNGRTVKNITMTVALEESYKGSIMVGRFPACVLKAEISPAVVDVNVHPTKTEIRFSNERIIYDAVYYACKSALSADSGEAELLLEGSVTVKTASFSEKKPAEVFTGMQAGFTDNMSEKKISVNIPTVNEDTIAVFNDATERSTINGVLHVQKLVENPLFDKQKSDFQNEAEKSDINKSAFKAQDKHAVTKEAPDRFAGAKIIGELFETYIMLENGDSLYLVDKHATHERLIYNQMKLRQESDMRQYLLEPVVSRFSREEADALLTHRDDVASIGFEISDFGNGSVIIRSVPPMVSTDDAPAVLSEIASNLSHYKKEIQPQLLDDILHIIACRCAIKAHDKNSRFELSFLIECLKNDENVKFCPHGRPVTIKISKSDIEKRFGRIQ